MQKRKEGIVCPYLSRCLKDSTMHVMVAMPAKTSMNGLLDAATNTATVTALDNRGDHSR